MKIGIENGLFQLINMANIIIGIKLKKAPEHMSHSVNPTFSRSCVGTTGRV